MKTTACVVILIAFLGCASTKTTNTAAVGDTRTKRVQFIDDETYLLTDYASDATYGYEKSNPVKVGGIKERSGPRNERRFLNALLGPNGEQIVYTRAGSCCQFKTPNGLIENAGLLDRYLVSWVGASDTLTLYINMYDEGDLFIPNGFSARQPR